jgi:hypothetical protein
MLPKRHDLIDLTNLIEDHARELRRLGERLYNLRCDLALVRVSWRPPYQQTPSEIRDAKRHAALTAAIGRESARYRRHRNALAALAARGVVETD